MKSGTTGQVSRLSPGPQFAAAPADQEWSAKRRWGSEPERLARNLLRPPFAAARTVQVGRAATRRSSEPVLERSGRGCRDSVLVVAVGCQAREASPLGSASPPWSGSEAIEYEEVEYAEGGTDVGRRHHPRPSAAPPCSVFLPLFSSASQAEARGAAKSHAAMAEVVRPAGARAGSEVLGTASALQHWRSVHVDEGVCGGVSGLWRWRLALGKL
jgi:hypothetical protein